MTTTARRPAVLAAALALASVVGCSSSTDSAPQPAHGRATHPTGPLPPVEVETGVVHVHGLGVDPADGALYAATHSGLFRIPEQGAAERVANRAQDTMGFSVVGPRTFLGSGHPDVREDDVRPPLLGLIESDDAGRTWKRVSLHGEADFHALVAAHGLVYGYDATSGTFMVSADRTRWEHRSRLPVHAFAVDPGNRDTVVATTPQGLVRELRRRPDVGAASPGAPPLVVLAWPPRGALHAAAGDGSVHRSDDAGRTWVRTGRVGGEPEALTVDVRAGTTSLYVAVAGEGIVVSDDGGRTFATRYAP